MRTRVLVVSNMYPGPATPYYGGFVASHVARLEQDPRLCVRVTAIRDPRKGTIRSCVKYCALFADLLRQTALFRPDVVHYHYALPTALLAPTLTATTHGPYVVTLHGGDFWEMQQRIPNGAALMRHVLTHASHLIVVSQTLARDVEQFLGTKRPPVTVINMGIDVDRFALAPAASPSRVLLVGQLIARKGGDVALRALAVARQTHPNLILSLVGAGPARRAWEELADSLALGAAVRFLGVVSPEAMPNVMAEHGTLLVPSRREPLGLVALEGMAVGLTVIASRTGGLAELVQSGDNGFLVTPDDVEALAQAMVLAQTTPSELRATMRQRARSTAMAHAVTQKVSQVTEILIQTARHSAHA